MFEHAKWITRPGYEGFGPHGLGPAPYFKKTFSVKNGLVKATLSACGLGMAVYYANGQTIGDQVLITPLTKFDARVLYSTFDLTANLQEGENTIGACLGNGWYNTEHAFWQYHMASWRDVPKMVAQLDLMYADESREQIVTDLSWLSHDAPTLWNDPRGGEEYDARLELPDWCQPFGPTDGWKPAVMTKSPGGALLPMQHPPIRITRRLEGQRVTDTIWDFGQNFSGWVKITVEGEAGAAVLLEYSELFENGDIDNTHISVFDNGKLKNADRYILKGEGQEIWAPMFQYHGFRWCKVTISGAARLVSIVGEVVHTDFSIIGDFSCSDDMLNRIHTAVRWSTLCNYHGIPTDCPHREQNGWTGDASLSAEQSLMNYDMKEAYRKWMMDFCDVQRPSGQIPAIVPTCSWGYNWGSGPAWDSAMMLIPYYVWQNTGDSSLIEQMWEPLNRYMDFIATMAVDDLCEFGLGDWCPPPGANICPTKLTDSAYYYVFATTMVICSGIMKDKEREGQYRDLALRIRKAFRKEFLTESGDLVGDSQTAIACAIYQGLLDRDEIPKAAAHLAELVKEKDYHLDCGILGTKYIFSSLSENGYADVAYRMVVNPAMPSYAYWLNNGLTTLGEFWNLDVPASRFHHMFSEVDMWFYKHLAGIQPLKPGYEEVLISPCFVEGLDWVEAHHRDIKVKWDRHHVVITTPVKGIFRMNDKEYPLTIGSNTFAR